MIFSRYWTFAIGQQQGAVRLFFAPHSGGSRNPALRDVTRRAGSRLPPGWRLSFFPLLLVLLAYAL